MHGLSFDRHQFDGQANWNDLPASQRHSLTMDDTARMQTQFRSQDHFGWLPPFAFDTEKLRHVLLVRAWRYLHGRDPLPQNLDWAALNKKVTAKALAGYPIRPDAPAKQHEMQAAHIAAVRRAGGYLQMVAAIAYRAWRLGEDSVQVAASIAPLKPWSVRAHLQRLRDIARQLGYDVGAAHASRGKKKKPRKQKPRRGRAPKWVVPVARAVALYREGKCVAVIARRLGFPAERGQNAVRLALIARGAYKKKSRVPVRKTRDRKPASRT